MFTVSLEIDIDWAGAMGRLKSDLEDASFKAAESGIEEVQANHPYVDRTYQLTERAHAEHATDGDAEMVWPKEYASFVNGGTRRMRARPFTPQAEQRAESALDRLTEEAIAAIDV